MFYHFDRTALAGQSQIKTFLVGCRPWLPPKPWWFRPSCARKWWMVRNKRFVPVTPNHY